LPPKVKTYIGNSNPALGQLLGDAFVAQNPNAVGEVVLGNDLPSLPLLVLVRGPWYGSRPSHRWRSLASLYADRV
jgi:hypothetical protein